MRHYHQTPYVSEDPDSIIWYQHREPDHPYHSIVGVVDYNGDPGTQWFHLCLDNDCPQAEGPR